MAIILIRCPKTNLPVATGFFMDHATFKAAEFADSDRRLRCPDCDEVHVWRKDEAYLIDEELPVPTEE